MRCTLLVCFFLSVNFLFSQVNAYEEIDRHAKHAPLWKKFNVDKLTAYLVEPCSTEKEKVRAIYTWMARHIRYDVKRYEKQKLTVQTPKKTLWRRKALCGDYASLFNAMCKSAGITSLQVIGYTQGTDMENDDLFYNVNHAWNAVRLDGEWYLLDVTYGAGYIDRVRGPKDYLRALFTFRVLPTTKKFRRKPDYFYFLTLPCAFAHNHLPSEQAFQLLPSPVSVSDFENQYRDSNCYGKDTTDLLREVGVSSTLLDEISNLPPTEYFAWEGDSANNFNCRSVLQQAIDYEKTGSNWITASTVKHEEQLSVEDKQGLETALVYLDSSRTMIPASKEMAREEAYFRSQKNRYRNKLAKADINRCAKHQRMLMAKTASLKNKDKKKMRDLRGQNNNILLRIERINEVNLDAVSMRKDPDPVEAGNIIAQNRKTIILNEDSIGQALLVLQELYKVVNEQLLLRMEVLDTQLTNTSLRMKQASEWCAFFRFHHLDDLDPQLTQLVKNRDSLIQVSAYYLLQKDSCRKQLTEANDSSWKWINRIRMWSVSSSKHLKENKKWGDAETYNLLEKLKSQVQQLELIIQRNELWHAYLKKEIPWSKKMYKQSKKIKKILNEEGVNETWRFQEKNNIVQNRRRALIKTANQVGRNASRQQRVVKKLLDN